MKKRIIPLFFALIYSSLVLGTIDPNPKKDYVPNVIPPSPTASELGRYGQIPVGMFTGTAQVSIPLYTLTSSQLSIPISLSYSSNGIKVDQVASWIGLGWSLNAGGVITRTIRGQEDEKTSFPVPSSIEDNTYETHWFLNYVWDDMLDTEPDLFSFNFAGYTGSFIMHLTEEQEFEIVLVPFQNLKVDFEYDLGELDSFIITAPDGIQYFFGGDYIETSLLASSGYNCSRSYDGDKRTSWYLYQIVHPYGDTINFSYASNYFSYSTGISQTITRAFSIQSCGGNQCDQPSQTDCKQVITAKTWHLTEIEASNGRKIIFSSSKDREDLGDCKLNYT